jgi:quinol monooxygenase YgiN
MKFRTPSLVVALLSLYGSACSLLGSGAPEVVTKPAPPARDDLRALLMPRAEVPAYARARQDAKSLNAAASAGEGKFDEVFTEDEVDQFAIAGDSAGPSDAVFTADEVEQYAKEEGELPSGVLPMFGAIVLQKVNDYDAWRAAFDQHLDARKRAGFVAQGVMRGIDNTKLVAVWLAVTDVAQAKAFFADMASPEHSKAAAVVGKPRIQLSRNVSAHMEPGRESLTAAIVALRVQELQPFKLALEAQAKARLAAGVIGYALGQDVDDEGLAYLYLQSEEPSALRAYLASHQTKELWREAGLVAISSVTVVKESELTLCH